MPSRNLLLLVGGCLAITGCFLSTEPRRTCPYYGPIGSLDTSPTWSPDGRFVAYDHGKRNSADSSGIYVVAASGGVATRIADVRTPVSPQLAWSPDGSRIAMYLGDIWTVQISDRSLRRWTNRAPYARHPSWSPDGRYLLYVADGQAYDEPDSSVGLHIIDTFDGTQRAVLHNGLPTFGGRADWSPDGQSLVFISGTGNLSANVFTMRLDGSSYRQLTNFKGIAMNPQWSADGSMIFFDFTPPPCLPEHSADRRTYAMNADGSGLRRWPVNLGDPRVTFAFPFDLGSIGDVVAFVGLDSGRKRGVIWTMKLNGSDRRQLTFP